MGQHYVQFILNQSYQLTAFAAYVVSYGRQKPLIGQRDTETTAGQVQQLLIVLSAMDVMWFRWHIVSVDNINEPVSVETVILKSRNCTDKQLDANTTDSLSYVTSFHKDRAIDR